SVNLRRGAVCIGGQEHRSLAAVHVGDIHAAVGAHQPVHGFGDEDVLFAHHAPGLAQGQLHHASVGGVVAGKTSGGSRWLHRIERNHAALGLGYDLVFDHEDVAVLKTQTAKSERVHDEARNGVAGGNVANTGHGNRAQFAAVYYGRRWHQTAAFH